MDFIHEKIVDDFVEVLGCQRRIAEAILQEERWGKGWVGEKIIIFVLTKKFSKMTEHVHDEKIRDLLKKSRTRMRDGRNLVVANNTEYMRKLSGQYEIFYRLLGIDPIATIMSTDFGCYFLSGSDYHKCGANDPFDFFRKALVMRRYYKMYAHYVNYCVQEAGSLDKYCKVSYNYDISNHNLAYRINKNLNKV